MIGVAARNKLLVFAVPALINSEIAKTFEEGPVNPFEPTTAAMAALSHRLVIPQLQGADNYCENKGSTPKVKNHMLDRITVHGARQHNLKNIDVEIPRNSLTVITGLSGSGKSSLAFDTIYAEGQRRYVETLSTYARQFLDQMERPDVDSIEGLSPAISIEQKTTSRSPRSTVG